MPRRARSYLADQISSCWQQATLGQRTEQAALYNYRSTTAIAVHR